MREIGGKRFVSCGMFLLNVVECGFNLCSFVFTVLRTFRIDGQANLSRFQRDTDLSLSAVLFALLIVLR